MLDELHELSEARDSPHALVEAASRFKSHADLARLMQETAMIRSRSSWIDINHHIGRLGTWQRISRSLTTFACHFPQIIEGFQVKLVTIPPPVSPPTADAKTTLDSALKRMLPREESDRAGHLDTMLDDLRTFDIAAAFEEKYRSSQFTLHVHAELLLLEFLYTNGLAFVEGERYIGCSKPSCYCCGLYMRYHPGNFVLRPCHSNVWPNWSPPIRIDAATDERDWKHVSSIVNDMNKYIRRDVVREIETRAPRRMREPDSTTGDLS